MIEKVAAARRPIPIEKVPLEEAEGRVLAEQIHADRDYPPVARAQRDGFAVRAADTPGRLRLIGEAKAGEVFAAPVRPGEAVEIMTGASVPEGADAIVMIEQARREGEYVCVDEAIPAGRWVNPPGAEARRNELLMSPGRRIGYVEVAMLAMVGCSTVAVYRRPRIAVLPTGDEVVELELQPREHQVRNSNAYSLAAQIRRAGGAPVILPVARDELERMKALIRRGLEADLLLISGGVSAGKYDLVERALAELGAEFFFDSVLVQPGYPLVFGQLEGVLFFGLPGNPACTMVTFELFGRPAVEMLGGSEEAWLALLYAKLAVPFRHKPGLTRLVPARLEADGATVTPLSWRGSGDVVSLLKSNAFMVADPERESWEVGDWIKVLLR